MGKVICSVYPHLQEDEAAPGISSNSSAFVQHTQPQRDGCPRMPNHLPGTRATPGPTATSPPPLRDTQCQLQTAKAASHRSACADPSTWLTLRTPVSDPSRVCHQVKTGCCTEARSTRAHAQDPLQEAPLIFSFFLTCREARLLKENVQAGSTTFSPSPCSFVLFSWNASPKLP